MASIDFTERLVARRAAIVVLALSFLAVCSTPFARAQMPAPRGIAPPELAAGLAGARLRGQGTLVVGARALYEAQLWVSARPPGADWSQARFALALAFARTASGQELAQRAMSEMRLVGDISEEAGERWLGTLQQLFADVKSGGRFTGIHLPGRGARFYLDGEFRGELREAALVRAFFGIWLSPRTPHAALRQALLGVNTAAAAPP